MIFRIKHMYVTVSPLVFAVVIWVVWANKVVSFGLCLIALMLHEMGHIVMIYLLQEKIAIFRILPFGFSCRLKNQNKVVCKKMIKILFAGPAVNFFTAGLFFLGTKEFAVINLLLGIFNLLPIGELDGGRIFCIIEMKQMR